MIQVADGFDLKSKKPLDGRIQYASVADMKAVPEANLYDGCTAYVTATKKKYTFDSTNTVDSTTGKWREDTGGGSETTELSDLNDVEIESPADGEGLFYDAETGKWINKASGTEADLSDLGDVEITDPQDGDILTYDAANNVWKNMPNSGGSDPAVVNGYAYIQPLDGTIMSYINCINSLSSQDKQITVSDPTIFNGKTCNALYMFLGPLRAYLLFSEYGFTIDPYSLKKSGVYTFVSSRHATDETNHPGYRVNSFTYANGISALESVTIKGTSEEDCQGIADNDIVGKLYYIGNVTFKNSIYDSNIVYIQNPLQFYSDSAHTTVITPESGKMYVDTPTGDMYEWDGSKFNKIGGSVSYNDVSDKPKINNVELSGNKTAEQLGLVTKAVNDLVNYYLKTETYTKAEVDAIASAIKNTRFEVVSSLPTTNIKTNVIYLVPSSSVTTDNVKDEYINLDGTTSGWELIGSTSVDLSGYVTDSELNTALADYTTTAALTLLLAAKQDANDKMTAADMDDVISKVPAVRFFSQRFYITNPRWLRFDASNKKGLVILGGTSIRLSNGQYADFLSNTHIDLSTDVTQAGKDYFVYINDNKEVHAYVSKQSSGTYIGRFHTLCVNAGTLTMKVPASPSSGLVAGGKYLVKPYREEDDPDFYAFYNKTISSVTVGAKYDVIVCPHPLSGYSAGDILPESVFCRSFKPNTMFEDAMVYDKATDIVVDIYLQSGTGLNTRSAYNQTHTVNREPYNHMGDMLTVGKRLLRDNEFTSIALGSNEGTNINGSADATAVGGHSDTDGRRMISVIGVEEACGYLYQWLQEVSSPGTGTQDNWDSEIAISDGQGTFGKEYWTPYVAHAGGAWGYGVQCGSRCRCFNLRRSRVSANGGGRGSSQVKYF